MGLEEGRAAMAAQYGDKISPTKLDFQTGKAPESSTSAAPPPVINNRIESPSDNEAETTTSTQTPELNAQEQQQLEDFLDLTSLGKKIKIGDDVFTPEELKKSLLRQQDYTKKTQGLAAEKKKAEEFQKFSKAFKSDLNKLLENPDIYEEEFRSIYPAEFQELYDMVKESRGAQKSYASTRDQVSEAPVQPELKRILDTIGKMDIRLSGYESQVHQAQMEKETARLDNILSSLHTKYDLGSEKANKKLENLVLARAQMLDRDPTDQDFARFFKEEHEEFISFAKEAGEKQFRAQKSANQQAKDTASGGGTASAAPTTPKTFKEARAAMESHLSRTR